MVGEPQRAPTKRGQLSEIEKLRSEDAWPYWPVLPMKRRVEGQSWPELGFVVAGSLQRDVGRGARTVFLGPVHELRTGDIVPQLQGREKVEHFDSLEDMVAAGWVVD